MSVSVSYQQMALYSGIIEINSLKKGIEKLFYKILVQSLRPFIDLSTRENKFVQRFTTPLISYWNENVKLILIFFYRFMIGNS